MSSEHVKMKRITFIWRVVDEILHLSKNITHNNSPPLPPKHNIEIVLQRCFVVLIERLDHVGSPNDSFLGEKLFQYIPVVEKIVHRFASSYNVK